MKGFFSKKTPRQIKKATANNKQAKVLSCQDCKLDKTCFSPKAKWTGKGKKKILLIGEAFGKTEDEDYEDEGYEEPTQFIGEAGQLLRDNLKEINLDLDEDFWKDNALACRPPNNRTPTKKELKCCKSRLDKVVEELKPKFIWLMGKSAIESFFMGRFSNLEISRWRGLCIPDPVTKAWVIPMYHPSFVLRRRDELTEAFFLKDLKFAKKQLKRNRVKIKDYKLQTKCLTDFSEVLSVFDYLETEAKKRKVKITFDYEATSLLPWGIGQRIWTISLAYKMSNGKPFAFAFPFDYEHWDLKLRNIIKERWKKILLNKNVLKICHNSKFEDIWSRVIFGIKKVEYIIWCTMINAHIIDCRKRFTGLKFQTFINWGIENYGENIKQYMKVNKLGINSLNEVLLDDLLLYNAYDSLFTYMLYERQVKFFKRNKLLNEGRKLFKLGSAAFADSQCIGINVNEKYYLKTEQILSRQIKRIENKILNGKISKLYKKHTGKDLIIKKDIGVNDLRTIFFDILKVKPLKETAKGFKSIDAESLEKFNHSFARLIVKRRKLTKILSTYIIGWMKHIYDSKIRPFLNLQFPRSYRSSSDNPNLHNVPKRDKTAQRIARSGIIPSKGNKLIFFDYGSMEVRIIACYSKDKNLVKYVCDKSTDMHRDQAEELFSLKHDTITGEIRFYAKNQFVFPEFYGSYWRSCARNLWNECMDLKTGEEVKLSQHLVNKGIIENRKDYNGFEEHVKMCEQKFWRKFYGVKEWQEGLFDSYIDKCYVEMKTGFRRSDLLSRNKIINTPIQGSAFHCLLWSYWKVNQISKNEEWKSKLIGQIHDEMILDVCPKEEKHIVEVVKDVMENQVREKYSWIIVPLEAEIEMTPIDGTWFQKGG